MNHHRISYFVSTCLFLQIIMDKGLLNKGGTVLFDNAVFYGQAYAKDCSPEKYPNGWGVNQSNAFVAADTRVERVKTLHTSNCFDIDVKSCETCNQVKLNVHTFKSPKHNLQLEILFVSRMHFVLLKSSNTYILRCVISNYLLFSFTFFVEIIR